MYLSDPDGEFPKNSGEVLVRAVSETVAEAWPESQASGMMGDGVEGVGKRGWRDGCHVAVPR